MHIDDTEGAEVLKALGHPVRFRIARGLCSHNCNVQMIAGKLGLSQPAVSRHLAVMRKAGVIAGVRKAEGTCYQVVHPFALALVDLIKEESKE